MSRRLRSGLVLALGIPLLIGAAELAVRSRHRCRLPKCESISGQVTLVALGDSIVAGPPNGSARAWPAFLADQLRTCHPGTRWLTVNAGQPGDTAPQGYARFDRDVAVHCPAGVLVAFGLNDCNPARNCTDSCLESQVPHGLDRSSLWRALRVRLEYWSQRFGRPYHRQSTAGGESQPRTSPKGFVDTLDAIVARTREIRAQPVLLTMTPLASHDAEGVRARAGTYETYNAIIRRQAIRKGLPLVELASGAPTNAFDPDGFHLTLVGQAWVADQVCAQLESARLWSKLAEESRE
jgi:lysophospholipase L1-like esterase